MRVRAINGATGGVLAQADVLLDSYARVQVTDVWNGSGGFALGPASFDRVAISVEPLGSEAGSVVGALSVIDNLTNATRILVLAPPGAPDQATFGF